MPRASLAESSIPLSEGDNREGVSTRVYCAVQRTLENIPLRLLLVARKSITGLLGERLVVSRLGGRGGVVGLSLDHVDSLLEVL